MKNVFLIVLMLVLGYSAIAQEEEKGYTMYQSVYLSPADGQAKMLEKAIKEHNAKFHAESPYKAGLQYVMAGANAGYYVWTMGPTMFGHLDDRPGEGAHDDDWDENVGQYVEKAKYVEYWMMNDKLSYTPEVYEPKKLFIYVVDIKMGLKDRWDNLVKKVKAVYDENTYEHAFRVYENAFAAGDGRDAAFVIGFDSWKWFDTPGPLQDDFDEMYGKGEWDNFIDEWTECIDGHVEEVRDIID